MTLQSESILALHSACDTITASNGSRSVDHSKPSTSTTPQPPTPTQVLAMTIKKKRRMLRSKDHDLRVELLLTSTIRHLCQEIGDHLRSRRLANSKRKSTMDEADSTATVRQKVIKGSHLLADDENSDSVRKQEVGPVEVSRKLPDSAVSGTLVAEERSDHDRQLKRKGNEEDSDRKRLRTDHSTKFSAPDFNERDPFGLDGLFESLRTCRVGGLSR